MDKEMKSLTESLCKAVPVVEKGIEKIVEKGDLTPGELDSLHKAAEFLYKMKECCSEEEMYSEGRSYGPYSMNIRGTYGIDPMMDRNMYGDMSGNGYSEARGRSPVTGRYVSRGMSMDNGYSGHSIEDRMIASLENQMDQAKTEYERKMIMDEIQHIRQGTR
jgi:hypothetical protein